MNKLKKISIVVILLMVLLVSCTKTVLANNSFKKVEYSEAFKNWLKLSDEEKKKVLVPRIYDVIYTNKPTNNLLYKAKLLGAGINSRYTLKDIIPENLAIRNQQQQEICWALASLSSLETNLAVTNYKNGTNTSKVYDFSERHMEYACSKYFANNAENEWGYDREPGTFGYWFYAESYLTNGLGAIDESEMPFENNRDLIDISGIQNKTVATQVYDTIDFPDYNQYTGAERAQIMNEIKQHIQNYGSVVAPIHMSMSGEFNCYINDTGALFCDDAQTHEMNHDVSIIGWDDNYSIDNFNEGAKPTSNGAWIVRNSYGERLGYNLTELKEELFRAYQQECIERGWNSAEEIPNEILEELGYTIENDKAYMKIGDNGIIYVSYEDSNISLDMHGIIKATDTVDYENIYQYDKYYPIMEITNGAPEVMLCNVFDKKTTGPEYLTQVSLYAPETYTCKVYVNPNGDGKTKDDMQFVQLKAGESETFGVGYHTLEFAKPIEITGNKFVVAIAIEGTREDKVNIRLEMPTDELLGFQCIDTETEKCFCGDTIDFDTCEWTDLGKISQEYPTLPDCDSTIKAFTVSELIDESLKSIEIVTPPTKTHYFEGENFDKTGMVVKANYRSRKNPSVILDSSSYSITNGNNLKANQTRVTITFEDQSVEQTITVEKNSVTELVIKTPPTKTEYKEGQSFDKTGMVVEATFKDGTQKTITDYTIENGNNVKVDQTKVTITYGEKNVEQPITVIPNPLIEINVTKAPNKTKYVVGQDFDKTGMVVTGTFQDESTQEIIDYTIVNGTKLTKEQTSVTIKYAGKTAEQPITVEEKTVTEITINKMPTKTQYIQNKEDLDLSGGSITVSYNDGTKEVIALNSELIEVSGFDNSKAGDNTITVKYETKNATFEVEIIEEAKAINSDFNNIGSKVNSAKYYMYTDPAKKSFLLIDLVVDGISRNDENDSYEYYYYLSSNKDENNIENWVKISEYDLSDNKIPITINTKDIKNLADISDMNNLYLFIKEVAIKGGNQSVKVSKAMELNSDINIETYLDDAKATPGNNTPTPTNNGGSNGAKTSGSIPYTGVGSVIIILSIITAVGIVFFIRYKNLSKYVR